MCICVCVCYHDWRGLSQSLRFVVLRYFLPFCPFCGGEIRGACGDGGSAWASEPPQTESYDLVKRREESLYFYYGVMVLCTVILSFRHILL